MSITINLRYFASIRESLDRTEETLLLPSNSMTVGQVRDLLLAKGEPYANALARGKSIRTALNHQMCEEDEVVSAGAEVAFFPPVTGG